ncbi:hypothetical protein BKA70DRAFT_1219531 [Coprinopsis sp. MPI-PUGE-AT-0042]|nr:hypothetical protein BKA70DRAFT_1219531 [Coprinopsis sp. MPI-PUGE-AT-0042]
MVKSRLSRQGRKQLSLCRLVVVKDKLNRLAVLSRVGRFSRRILLGASRSPRRHRSSVHTPLRWSRRPARSLETSSGSSRPRPFLVALPLALALEDEAKIVAQEKEMMEQQQGAQLLANGASPYGLPPAEGQQPKAIVPPGF